MTVAERVSLAADVATGQKQFVPSLSHLALLFHVNVAALRAELKARNAATAAADGNGEMKTLADMAIELVARLGLDAAFDLLVEVTER
jgi:hypothetical protein